MVKRKRIRYATHTMRKRIYKRDAGQCQYCGVEVSIQQCNFDHVIPFSRGGSTNQMNLVVCCRGCNELKYIQVIPEELRPQPGHALGRRQKDRQPRRRRRHRKYILAELKRQEKGAVIQMADAMGVYVEDLFGWKTLRRWRRA